MKKVYRSVLIVSILLISFALCFESNLNNVKMCVRDCEPKSVRGEMNMEIDEYLGYINKINVIVNGKRKTYLISDNEFRLILSEMGYILGDCHDMPAFGVSIHNETVNAMKKGVWVEFFFPDTMTHNEMPFDGWLVQVEKDFTGFNIIRKYQEKYDGRCLYMRLMNGKSLDGLYRLIEDIK